MAFNLLPLDFSDILGIGLGVSNMFQRNYEFDIQKNLYDNQFKVFKSQRDLNKKISAFNLSSGFASANRQASAIEVAFASAGFSGPDVQKEADIYRNQLYLSALAGN